MADKSGKTKCHRCDRYVDEFVPNCCVDCYLAISTELYQQYLRENKISEERRKKIRNDFFKC